MAVFGFYSMKGGSSRTTLVANLGAMLALKGLRIGMVDADIEGSGLDIFLATALQQTLSLGRLHRLSETLEEMYSQELTGTLVDVLYDEREPSNGDRYWLPATDILSLGAAEQDNARIAEALGDRLWILPCGRNWGKLARLRYTNRVAGRLRRLVIQMQTALQLDHVLVDCRSGIADSALVSALSVDCLVMPFVLSHAHLLGTIDATKVLTQAIQMLPWCAAAQAIHYVAAKIPGRDDATADAIAGAFDSKQFYPLTSPVTVVPFHAGMLYRERLPCLGSSEADEDREYVCALGKLWKVLEGQVAEATAVTCRG